MIFRGGEAALDSESAGDKIFGSICAIMPTMSGLLSDVEPVFFGVIFRIMKQTQAYIVPDAFTHGTSEQRVWWFYQGDTFNASQL